VEKISLIQLVYIIQTCIFEPLLTKNLNNMKKVKHLAVVAVIALFAAFTTTSCGVLGLQGILFTKVKGPHSLTQNDTGTKVGSSKAMNILNLVAIGDYGYNEAIKKGNIKKVSHVDIETFSVLGLFATYTTYVYGN
jgi:hypothetical protein